MAVVDVGERGPITPRQAVAVVVLVAGFLVGALSQALSTSPTYDEPTHLAAGYSYWRWHDYRLNPEHPPLLKRLAALPALLRSSWPADLDLENESPPAGKGSIAWREAARLWRLAVHDIDAQWLFAQTFLYGVDDATLQRLQVLQAYAIDPSLPVERGAFLDDAQTLIYLARLPSIFLGAALALLAFAWARELFGSSAALFALALYACDPNLIAHSALVTTDVAATAFLFAAVYLLWRGGRHGRPWQTLLAALCLGLALASKFTAILLIPVFALLIFVSVAPFADAAGPRRAGTILRRGTIALGLCAAAGTIVLCVVWAAYGFRYQALSGDSAPPLPIAETLRRGAVLEDLYSEVESGPLPADLAQQLARTQLGVVEHSIGLAQRQRLLPESYLYGLAYARMKSRGRVAFLRGEVSSRGFPTYFLWTFLLKTPLVGLVAIAASMILVWWQVICHATHFGRRRPLAWRDLLFLLLPVAVLASAAITSHLNIGHRHLLPIYPFLYVLCGALLAPLESLGFRRVLPVVLAAVVLGSSVVFVPLSRPTLIFPHYLAYFNEIAGGPSAGYRHLVDSNLDWGQDLPSLAVWLDERGIEEPILLCYFGLADPRYHGIRHHKLPLCYPFAPPFTSEAALPKARWLAVSATHLQGVYFPPDRRASWQAWLATAEPVDTVGHSIFIFQLDPE